MGHHKLRDIMGILKDKASQSKAALVSKPNTLSLNLAVLRATTHDPLTPPNPKHISTILSFGHSSRATACSVIELLMDRLHHTHDASVALKSLITIHHIIKHGSFILQDQLSVYPTTGGRNYLNLSNFRDKTTPFSWELSSWVRWYGRYLEQLLSTSRNLGFFLCSTSSALEKEKGEENVLCLLNDDLLKEADSLATLIEEMCKIPESLHFDDNMLFRYVKSFVGDDYLSGINEVWIRVEEFNKRLSLLSFAESVELACVLKRLEDCKERLALVFNGQSKVSVDSFWDLVLEVKNNIGMRSKEGTEKERRRMVGRELNRKWSESARFQLDQNGRVAKKNDSVSFSSGRFDMRNSRYSLTESIEL